MISKKEQIRIGIDARPMQGETKHRGIGKALENLIYALKKSKTKHLFIYYVDPSLDTPGVLQHLNNNESLFAVKSSSLGRKKYLRSVLKSFKPVKPSKDDIDIFYQFDASLGVPSNVPSVVVFHDLIPALFRNEEKQKAKNSDKKYKSMVANELYWKKYKKDLAQYKKSKKIIAISEASKNDLVKYMSTTISSDISVIYHGADGKQSTLAQSSVKFDSIQALKPYILYVGGIDYRKNIARLLDDFYTLKKRYPDLRLVLIGKEFLLDNQLNNLGWDTILDKNPTWKSDVIRPGFVTDDELVAYYQNAEAFIFPSLYEGFGLPILEAMAIGVPVITYSNSSIPEVAGNAAIVVENNASFAPAIKKLLDDKQSRDKLVALGKRQARKFTWDKAATETINVIEETYHAANK